MNTDLIKCLEGRRGQRAAGWRRDLSLLVFRRRLLSRGTGGRSRNMIRRWRGRLQPIRHLEVRGARLIEAIGVEIGVVGQDFGAIFCGALWPVADSRMVEHGAVREGRRPDESWTKP